MKKIKKIVKYIYEETWLIPDPRAILVAIPFVYEIFIR